MARRCPETAPRSRAGRIIYYNAVPNDDGDPIRGFTVGEWLCYWTQQWLWGEIGILDYLRRIDFITVDMPGALDPAEWDEHTDYLRALALRHAA